MDSLITLKDNFDKLSELEKVSIIKNSFVCDSTKTMISVIEKFKKMELMISIDFNQEDWIRDLIFYFNDSQKIIQSGCKNLLIAIFTIISENKDEFNIRTLEYFYIEKESVPYICIENKNHQNSSSNISINLDIKRISGQLYYHYDNLKNYNAKYPIIIGKISILTLLLLTCINFMLFYK
jgi:hypothetical protein